MRLENTLVHLSPLVNSYKGRDFFLPLFLLCKSKGKHRIHVNLFVRFVRFVVKNKNSGGIRKRILFRVPSGWDTRVYDATNFRDFCDFCVNYLKNRVFV